MKKLALLSAVAALGLAAGAQAATYSLSANVSNVFDASFNPLATNPGHGSADAAQNAVPGGVIYQIDLYISVSNLGAGQRGFGSLSMDLTLPAGVTQDASVPGWQADPSNTDTNGAAPSGGTPLWGGNADNGAAGDLKNIVVYAPVVPNPTATDFRAKIGQVAAATAYTASIANCVNATGFPDGKTLFGTIYVNWNGLENKTVVADLTQASYAESGTGLGVTDLAGVLNDAQVRLVAVPEPASLSLLGLGGLALAARRRRA